MFVHVSVILRSDWIQRATLVVPRVCQLGSRTRVGYLLPEIDLGLWMLIHADLRRSPRVRAFMDFAGAELTRQRRAIEGEETGETE